MIGPNNHRAAAAAPPPSKLSPHAPPFTGGRQARASAPPPPPPSAASYYHYYSASADVSNVVGGVLTGDDVELGLSLGPWIQPSDVPENDGGKGGDSTLSLPKGRGRSINFSVSSTTTSCLPSPVPLSAVSQGYAMSTADVRPSFASATLAPPSSILQHLPSISSITATSYHPYSSVAHGESFDIKESAVGGSMWIGQSNLEIEKNLHKIGGSSSCLDPFMYYNSLSPKGDSTDGFMSYEDASRRWHGKYENVVGGDRCDLEKHLKTYDKDIKTSSNILQSPAYGSGPLLEGFDGLNLAALSLPMNVHSNFKANAYNIYEASSCSYSEDPVVNYSSPVCPTSTEAANASTKNMDTLKFKNKIANRVPFQESQIAVTQIDDGKTASFQRSKDSRIMSYNIGDVNYSPLKVGNEVTNPKDGAEVITPQSRVGYIGLSDSFLAGNHMDSYAEIESGLRSRPSVIPETLTPTCVFKEYGDSKQTLPEAHDQFILAVDSPCWKGAPTSWQSPFTAGQRSDYHVLQQDSNGCDGNGNVQNSVDGGKKIDLLCANTEFKEQRNFSANNQERKSGSIACSKNIEVKNGNLKQSVEEELGSTCQDLSAEISSQEKILKNLCDTLSDSSFCSKARASNLSGPEVGKIDKLGLPDLPPKSPTIDENVGLLVKKIHNLSGILCAFYDTGELVEYDVHLLQSVMNILSTSIRRNGKASEKVLAHTGETNIEALAYKNLWIQAEEALRSIKYEHELTLLKLTMETQKYGTKEKSKSIKYNCIKPTSPNLQRPSSTDVQLCNDSSTSVGQTDKISQSAPYTKQDSSSKAYNADEIDASVMTRLRILKGRNETCNIVEQEKDTGYADSYAKGKGALESPFAGSEKSMGIKASLDEPSDIGYRDAGPKGRMQKFGAICDVDSIHGSCSPEQATTEIHACTPLIRSYYANLYGNRHFVEGSDAASSEWEHV